MSVAVLLVVVLVGSLLVNGYTGIEEKELYFSTDTVLSLIATRL